METTRCECGHDRSVHTSKPSTGGRVYSDCGQIRCKCESFKVVVVAVVK